ncbi:MAG: biotin/lipoyl-containing protein, partial [bacterium]
MSVIEVRVPDIGDFQDVEIIEILVKPGDSVEAETSMITLESDKATMDVPAPQAGVVAELLVKVGDRVSEGNSILKMEPASATDSKNTVEESPKTASVVQEPPQAATHSGKADLEAQVVVLGSGPGGYTAAFRAADLGLDTILIEKGKIGGVCLNVGCIPSKALLHAAKVIEEAQSMSSHGIKFGTPEIDIDSLRSWKDSIVGKLVGGLTGMSKQRKVRVVEGYGEFLDPFHIRVATEDGGGSLVTNDASCTVPRLTAGEAVPFRNTLYITDKNEDADAGDVFDNTSITRTAVGYVEIIEMGQFKKGKAATAAGQELQPGWYWDHGT